MNLDAINELIECTRRELNRLANIHGIIDERVLNKSMELDQIINVYIRNKRLIVSGNQDMNTLDYEMMKYPM
ncbi:aspartyl-phosphate phosphatase Spo0E family protein [Paenibacillus sp. IHBB 10380]|uniref:aspartyl-phosphate phosphatase Spo0E family protein n=1 Tax=Paenibacillus sp. IHBB 10380 TaxID=1566358 RepID=UPI0005CFEEDE|nr:aspartyl-phosphate phosphatase Spo0E family protein [Paenibacillus sp. IHBB 10380]AJS60491.1 hypothetical protein UB51_20820 [Paenibacillus sp. IHBB 10380]